MNQQIGVYTMNNELPTTSNHRYHMLDYFYNPNTSQWRCQTIGGNGWTISRAMYGFEFSYSRSTKEALGNIGFERMKFGMFREKNFAREREEFLEIIMILQRMVS